MWLVPLPTDAQKCELICQSEDTGAVVFMNQVVHDGTRCSYRDPYSICARGECVVGAPCRPPALCRQLEMESCPTCPFCSLEDKCRPTFPTCDTPQSST